MAIRQGREGQGTEAAIWLVCDIIPKNFIQQPDVYVDHGGDRYYLGIDATVDVTSPTGIAISVPGNSTPFAEIIDGAPITVTLQTRLLPRIEARAGIPGPQLDLSTPVYVAPHIRAGVPAPAAWGAYLPYGALRGGQPHTSAHGHTGHVAEAKAGSPTTSARAVFTPEVQARAGVPSISAAGLDLQTGEESAGSPHVEAWGAQLPHGRMSAGTPISRAYAFGSFFVQIRSGQPLAAVTAYLYAVPATVRAGSPHTLAYSLDPMPAERWDGLYSPAAMRALVDGVVVATEREPRAASFFDVAALDASVLPHLAWYWGALAYYIGGDETQHRSAVAAAKRLTVEIGTEAAINTLLALNGLRGRFAYLAETTEGTPYPRKKNVALEIQRDGPVVDALYLEYLGRVVPAVLPFTLRLAEIRLVG